MSKFFDELMESVKQADEIFRREHRADCQSSFDGFPKEPHQPNDRQRICKHRKSRPIREHDCATLESSTKRHMT